MTEWIVKFDKEQNEDIAVGELIRCKDCQKWQPNFMGRNVCYEWAMVTNSIDYCSRAERKEE